MSRTLAWSMATTDIAFLAYWLATAAFAAGWIEIPPAYLFAGYHDARVFAWNWSFLPLDVMFSIVGLLAIGAARRGQPSWRALAIASLVMSSAAGGMAVSYWTILGEFDPGWFLPNLALFLWPLLFLPTLVRTTSDG